MNLSDFGKQVGMFPNYVYESVDKWLICPVGVIVQHTQDLLCV